MHETCDQKFIAGAPTAHVPVRLGIIGGGQLARMTAIAALTLGVEVVVLESNPHSPAARLSPGCVVGDWADPATLMNFAGQCDVITLENEFVDAAALEALERAGHAVFPGSSCVAVVQDKLTQKSMLQSAGLGVVEHRPAGSPEEIAAAGAELGWPMVLKTRRNGYDGKGNVTLRSGADVADGWRRLGGGANPLMVEAWFPFVKELAVIVTRGRDGGAAVYPVVETIQREHVCRVVKAPAAICSDLAKRAAALARRAVEVVGGVGSFGVELFLSAGGELVINELAPRVHNSGHYTIEACHCSQFENHVRAVLGWPLGDPRMVAPAAVMVNLLGAKKGAGTPNGLETALRLSGARLHLYAKVMSGPGRKMGHVTALRESVEEALAVAERAAREIYFG
ncbi:MAG: 5-(carboxyamino)imidazole ribonucleotide synthase [Verrucomicrobiota bacterium]